MGDAHRGDDTSREQSCTDGWQDDCIVEAVGSSVATVGRIHSTPTVTIEIKEVEPGSTGALRDWRIR